MGCNLKFLFNENLSEIRIIMLGLDNAGKTSTMLRLKGEEPTKVAPTIGLDIAHLKHKNYSITIWDIGGKIKDLWHHYFQNLHAVIFVIDTNDLERMEEAKKCLNSIIIDPALNNCPILLFGNKIDLPKSISQQELISQFNINTNSPNILIQMCSAKENVGVKEGIEQLISKLNNSQNLNTKRIV